MLYKKYSKEYPSTKSLVLTDVRKSTTLNIIIETRYSSLHVISTICCNDAEQYFAPVFFN